MAAKQNSKDVANELQMRVYRAQFENAPISVAEFRILFLKGLAASVRELDSVSFRLKQLVESRGL